MKNSKLILIIGVLFLFVFFSCEEENLNTEIFNYENSGIIDDDSAPWIEEDIWNHYKSKLENVVIYSSALENNFVGNPIERNILVYLPPGYKFNGLKNYPVVYLLHGFPFSENAFNDIEEWDQWIDPNGLFPTYPDFPKYRFKTWIDNLIEQGSIQPMIIVMPDASTIPYGFSFYTNSALNGNFEDFIVEDLVSYVDNNFRTLKNEDSRAVIGHSQGGYAAFKFGMFHSDVFGTIASHCGFLYVDALFGPQFMELIEQENPDGLTGPDPAKFLTSGMYAMSAAWSPNLNNPPFYVDLPLKFYDDISNKHEGNHLIIDDEVVKLWHQNDVFSLIDTNTDALKSLNGIYLDVGMYDELGTQLAHMPVLEKLNTLGLEYTFEQYEGGHHSHLFERLAVSLEFCSEKMQ